MGFLSKRAPQKCFSEKNNIVVKNYKHLAELSSFKIVAVKFKYDNRTHPSPKAIGSSKSLTYIQSMMSTFKICTYFFDIKIR